MSYPKVPAVGSTYMDQKVTTVTEEKIELGDRIKIRNIITLDNGMVIRQDHYEHKQTPDFGGYSKIEGDYKELPFEEIKLPDSFHQAMEEGRASVRKGRKNSK